MIDEDPIHRSPLRQDPDALDICADCGEQLDNFGTCPRCRETERREQEQIEERQRMARVADALDRRPF